MTDTSDEVKSVAASDRVKVRLIELSLLVAPLATVVDDIDTAGAVPSYVQVKADEAALVLVAASENRFAGTEIDVAPSVVGVKVAE